MFIERLQNEDIYEFVSKYLKGYKVKSAIKMNHFYALELSSVESKPTLKFVLTDFSCSGVNIMAKCGEDIVEEKWDEYLSLKFRKEYKTEKLNYAKNISNDDIIK